MDWPPQSPDLSPIEMLWIDVDKETKRRKPRNLAELEAVVKEAWAAIPNDRCVRLIKSMPRRCQEVIKNKGYSTSY